MRDDLRLAAVAARLVAWHNRHPLARRISAAQVHAIGYVALPFAGAAAAGGAAAPGAGTSTPTAAAAEASADEAPAGASLRERALARARLAPAAPSAAPPTVQTGAAAPADVVVGAAWTPPPAGLDADFSEDFIDPLRPRAIARFALRFGRLHAGVPADGPVREVRSNGQHRGRATVPVYLLTAAIETGTRRSRVLLGAGAPPPVLGYRILSRARVAALVLVLAALAVGAYGLFKPAKKAGDAPAPAVAASSPAPARVAASSAASAASIASAALAASAVPAPAMAPETGSVAAREAPPVPAASAAAGPAVLSDADKAAARAATAAARQARDAARGSAPVDAAASSAAAAVLPTPGPVNAPARETPSAPPPARAAAPAPVVPPAAAPGQPAIKAATGAAFALSTRVLRTRAEADQVRVAMQALLRTVSTGDLQVEVLPEGDDWRVVGWPYARRADAERARELLVSRGMRVQVIGF